MAPHADVRAVDLPGRGRRWGEPCQTDMPSLVRLLTDELQSDMEPPFALFGHSMGATVGFEICRELRRRRRPAPLCLFVSAVRAPHLRDEEPNVHDESDDVLLQKLKDLGGTPDELLKHEELMRLMLPVLRADFQVLETYDHPQEEPFDFPIIAFGGDADRTVTREELQAWTSHTKAAFTATLLPGDHFYIESSRSALLAQIATVLQSSILR